jgi:hypothetical protein
MMKRGHDVESARHSSAGRCSIDLRQDLIQQPSILLLQFFDLNGTGARGIHRRFETGRRSFLLPSWLIHGIQFVDIALSGTDFVRLPSHKLKETERQNDKD